jgi:hypothetical protein
MIKMKHSYILRIKTVNLLEVKIKQSLIFFTNAGFFKAKCTMLKGLPKVNLDYLKGILKTPDEEIELPAINKIAEKINKSTNTKQYKIYLQ